MGLDQEILMLESCGGDFDLFTKILSKRNCYPLHCFINKWLEDTYKIDMMKWKAMPFGPYICLPFYFYMRFYTALKKRNIPCSCEIPPLVRRGLEGQLSQDLVKMVGSHVGGQCKYDRMFSEMTQDQWDSYPEMAQDDDFMTLRLEPGPFYYYASW